MHQRFFEASRFLASIGIVYLHSHEFFFDKHSRSTPWVAAEGLQLYVDLFFIISGFVMAFVYRERINSVSRYFSFIWKRVARLYPLHIFVFILNMIVWWVILAKATSEHAPSFSMACILTNGLLIQEYVNCGSDLSFNGVTWSISVEIGLYALMPLFIYMSRLSAWLLLALFVATAALGAHFLPAGGEWSNAPSLIRGLAGFTLGFVIFQVRARIPVIPHAEYFVVFFCILTTTFMLTPTPQVAIIASLVLLVVSAVSADNQQAICKVIDKLAPLGQLTYSIYIWHRLIILVVLNVIADKLFHGNVYVLIVCTALAYAGIFIISYAGYFLIEVPSRRWMVNLLHLQKGRDIVKQRN